MQKGKKRRGGGSRDSVSHGASNPELRIMCVKQQEALGFPLWCLRGQWRGMG